MVAVIAVVALVGMLYVLHLLPLRHHFLAFDLRPSLGVNDQTHALWDSLSHAIGAHPWRDTGTQVRTDALTHPWAAVWA